MAFSNPFVGNIERMITNDELIQALYLDLAGEIEAIFTYTAHIIATNNEVAKNVLTSIRNEELAHVGELMTLLQYLNPNAVSHFFDGRQEVLEKLNELGLNGNF